MSSLDFGTQLIELARYLGMQSSGRGLVYRHHYPSREGHHGSQDTNPE
jgi:hypothetical protein